MKKMLVIQAILAITFLGCASISPDSGGGGENSSGGSASSSSSGTSHTFGLFTETYPVSVLWDTDTKMDIWTDFSAGAKVTEDTSTYGDGVKSWKIEGTGDWIGIGVRVNPLNIYRGLNAYTNGCLCFMFKGTKASFKIGIKDGNGTEAWITPTELTAMGLKIDNTWCTVAIPLNNAAFSSIDFNKTQQYFMFVTQQAWGYEKGDVYHLDNVYYDKNPY